jgi:hypothetical protein
MIVLSPRRKREGVLLLSRVNPGNRKPVPEEGEVRLRLASTTCAGDPDGLPGAREGVTVRRPLPVTLHCDLKNRWAGWAYRRVHKRKLQSKREEEVPRSGVLNLLVFVFHSRN